MPSAARCASEPSPAAADEAAASHSATASGSHARDRPPGSGSKGGDAGMAGVAASDTSAIGVSRAHPDEPAAHGGAPALPAGRASAPGLVWLGAPPWAACPSAALFAAARAQRSRRSRSDTSARGVAALRGSARPLPPPSPPCVAPAGSSTLTRSPFATPSRLKISSLPFNDSLGGGCPAGRSAATLVRRASMSPLASSLTLFAQPGSRTRTRLAAIDHSTGRQKKERAPARPPACPLLPPPPRADRGGRGERGGGGGVPAARAERPRSARGGPTGSSVPAVPCRAPARPVARGGRPPASALLRQIAPACALQKK